MSKRIDFTVTSRNLNSLRVPAYAMQQDGETQVQAACRALASANGMVVIGHVHDEGDRGSVTIGTECRSRGEIAGYTPHAEVSLWIE